MTDSVINPTPLPIISTEEMVSNTMYNTYWARQNSDVYMAIKEQSEDMADEYLKIIKKEYKPTNNSSRTEISTGNTHLYIAEMETLSIYVEDIYNRVVKDSLFQKVNKMMSLKLTKKNENRPSLHTILQHYIPSYVYRTFGIMGGFNITKGLTPEMFQENRHRISQILHSVSGSYQTDSSAISSSLLVSGFIPHKTAIIDQIDNYKNGTKRGVLKERIIDVFKGLPHYVRVMRRNLPDEAIKGILTDLPADLVRHIQSFVLTKDLGNEKCRDDYRRLKKIELNVLMKTVALQGFKHSREKCRDRLGVLLNAFYEMFPTNDEAINIKVVEQRGRASNHISTLDTIDAQTHYFVCRMFNALDEVYPNKIDQLPIIRRLIHNLWRRSDILIDSKKHRKITAGWDNTIKEEIYCNLERAFLGTHIPIIYTEFDYN